ncbi:helix-turn-helix transcriptional regulator [Ruthenibacterium sp. CLA-JM-H11]|uniref:Helix-turn-helix transcriptional regulator n=1 Tax=Ruthenibacterium intestinale TaxID=3133163 RepID=A0ABV1GDU2_9FIRM
MKTLTEEMSTLTRIAKGIAAQFGKDCEVVLHDYTQSYESTIVLIENGHVTGRKVGDCGTNLGLEVLRGTVSDGDQYRYITQTKDGKILRSTSIYLRDEEGKAIGALCMNWDLTEFYACNSALKDILETETGAVEEVITNDVSELLDALIQDSVRYVGKPVISMTKEDKIKGLKYLDDKGAFLIKKAGDKISKFYDISKYTLYNYLEQSTEL